MGNKFEVAPGLDELVARMAARTVAAVADDAAAEAKRLAPATKVWVTKEDDRVRPTHQEMHGVEIPDNLRFEVTSMQYDIRERDLGPKTYMRFPKDDTSLAVANIINCRCEARSNPDGIRSHIHASEPIVTGTHVKAQVIAEHDKIIQAEFGDLYGDGRWAAEGTHFMQKAAARTQAKMRAGQ